MTTRIITDSLGRKYVSRRKERPCHVCGGQIYRTGKAKYCSRKCFSEGIKGRPLRPEIRAKRTYKAGEESPHWLGDAVTKKGGRTRALRAFPSVGPCARCGDAKAVRHHIDRAPANNAPDNIVPLCQVCHVWVHGKKNVHREFLK